MEQLSEIIQALRDGKKIARDTWENGSSWFLKDGKIFDNRGDLISFEIIDENCKLCGKSVGEKKLIKHHLTPKELGGRRTVKIHKKCHYFIHAMITNQEMKDDYHTIERLKRHPAVKSYIEYKD